MIHTLTASECVHVSGAEWNETAFHESVRSYIGGMFLLGAWSCFNNIKYIAPPEVANPMRPLPELSVKQDTTNNSNKKLMLVSLGVVLSLCGLTLAGWGFWE